jgi:hypothetical protein
MSPAIMPCPVSNSVEAIGTCSSFEFNWFRLFQYRELNGQNLLANAHSMKGIYAKFEPTRLISADLV